jgi:oligopeptidase B
LRFIKLAETTIIFIVAIASEFVFMQEPVISQDSVHQANDAEAPVAKKIPHTLEIHGDKRIDNYYWMRDRNDPKVIEYITAENSYMEQMLAPTNPLQEKLFNETVARIKETDQSAPYEYKGFRYYSRTEEGKQYRIYCRTQLGDSVSTPDEQVMLDVNERAKDQTYCMVQTVSISPDQNILVYSIDTVGRRKYALEFKNLQTGEMLSDTIEDVTGNLAWANDSRHLFYTRQDPQTLRAFQIYRHELGTEAAADVLVFEETDEQYHCYVGLSRSKQFIIIGSAQTLSTEFRVIDANNPTTQPVVFFPRQSNHEYTIDHINDTFYIRTNWNARNFRLMQSNKPGTAKESWIEVLGNRDDVFLNSFELYDQFLAVEERSKGMINVNFRKWDQSDFVSPKMPEDVYLVEINATPDTSAHWLRYSYESMTTPHSIRELNIQSGEERIIKKEQVLGGFDPENYRSKRLWINARDGVQVPVSIVYHASTALDGTAPCLLHGYGSYGHNTDPDFSIPRLNLLDRGFVYAIAHIRGGQEMGRYWYDDGKLLKKKNTFTDFIDAADYLVNEKICDPKRLYASGGSAGGLLMGAIVNMRPELFHGVIADVPFVDVVTTMLDETIPLTTSEYDEWGNPNEPVAYQNMLSYSPYDNVSAKPYPNMLVIFGLHDSQVQYWEPTKWVAKLRALKTDDNLLLLKTHMEAGHSGVSGRYDRFREIAFRHAFLLHLAGIDE